MVEYSIQEAVEYDGRRYPVTAIGYRAFDYLNYATSITIPNSVKRIGKSAFTYCGDLKYIKLPDGLESIEDYTFRWCSSFSKIVPYTMAEEEGDSCLFLPPSLKHIGVDAFADNPPINLRHPSQFVEDYRIKGI